MSHQPLPQSPTIAVLIPCYNEELSIVQVIQAFRRCLPEASIYVYDNNSQDRTRAVAKAAGAIVRSESLQGKGNVVRRMFADVEADIYVLIDGDDTYEATKIPEMIQCLIDNQLDMVNGARVTTVEAAYRRGHRFGNWMLTGIVRWIFGDRFRDMLSGFRVFSRRYVKSFPALAVGFEIETELTVHALHLRMPTAEIETAYRERSEGSLSKLSTFKDGWKILWMILVLVKEEKPLPFFTAISASFATLSILLMLPILAEFLQTGLVPRLPTAVLSMFMMVLGFLSLTCGLILQTVTRGRIEMKRLQYLSIPLVKK
nr:glycosyltransferase family 2 protein [uncultured Desulfobulbus sp.]